MLQATIVIGALLNPGGGIISWLIVGLLAGFFASIIVRGRSYGCILNIVVGLVGAVIGGFIADQLDLGVFHFWGSVFIAFIGACILVALIQLFTGDRKKS